MISAYIDAKSPQTNSQVAECAYESNVRLTPIKITPKKNSATIVCGPDGKVFPVDYKKEYCTGEPPNPCGARQYSDVLPGYTNSWWSGDPSSVTGATLTVPHDHFPRTAQTVKVACVGPDIGEVRQCVVTIDIGARANDSNPSGDDSRRPREPDAGRSLGEAPQMDGSTGTPPADGKTE